MRNCVIAIDIGGTNTRFALITRKGQILRRISVKTMADKGADKVTSILVEGCEKLLKYPKINVLFIGIVAPGPLNTKSGILLDAPNLKKLRNYPVIQIIEHALNIPAVLENDANCAAIGEAWLGAAKGYTTLIHLTLGTGIGGGIIIDGKIHHGRNDCAGELGHITINPEGVQCGCGNYGCLESYATRDGVVRRYIAKTKMPEYSDFIYKNLSTENEITPALISKAAKHGDKAAIETINETGKILGIAIAGFVNILNPEAVTLSGGITNAGGLLFNPTRKEVGSRTYKIMSKGLRIMKSILGDDAGLLGAAKVAFNRLDLKNNLGR